MVGGGWWVGGLEPIIESNQLYWLRLSWVLTTGYQDQFVAGNSNWMRRMADCWFSYLESLKLNCYDYDSDFDHPVIPICPELLKSVLMAAKNLSVLDLEGNCFDPVTDAYISEIVSVNPLTSMSTLHIGDANGEIGSIPLTVSTVQLLLSKCNCLKDLDISDWNVDSQQYEELKSKVKKNNWDLIIRRVDLEMEDD